jgi:hypothetical protein
MWMADEPVQRCVSMQTCYGLLCGVASFAKAFGFFATVTVTVVFPTQPV